MGGSATPYTVYFVAQFDRQASTTGTWSGTKLNAGLDAATGPASGAYFINTPSFAHIKVYLAKGTLEITGGSENKPYIQSLQVNGKAYDDTWLPWQTIRNGGSLHFEPGEAPNKNWGTRIAPPSFQ